MISYEARVWLLSMATMSVVSWVATASCLLILIDMDKLTGQAAVLLLAWIMAVSAPVTFHAISGWRRVRTVRRVLALGQKQRTAVRGFAEEITSLR
ncbi:hypothetical protein HD597_006807 [Nonomuraea thailandensis]|uniref:Uncharacterized protein n=1 Tax=Nonomuraea thailandensis TaxID=1188745 RepID=A0A9X2GLC3_9ACTN|nr:hypothetical protein [Nonomuraea thailandensis]MCP2359787.1 hypothetical protein [Nonomuraea thailandensis]